MVARRNPNVRLAVAARVARVAAPQARRRPSTSLALWPASERRARDPLIQPNTTSAATNATLRTTPMRKARLKSVGPWWWWPPTWEWAPWWWPSWEWAAWS